MKAARDKIEPGLYQYNLGGASLGECWRWSDDLFLFLKTLSWKLLGKKLELYLWLPAYEAERYCEFEELSERTREILAPEIKIASYFGFQNGRFKRMERFYSDGPTESGCYTAFHQNRQLLLEVTYAYSQYSQNFTGISNFAYFIRFYDEAEGIPTVVDNFAHYFDGCDRGKRIFMKTKFLLALAERAERELQQYSGPVQTFRDFQHLDEFIRPFDEALWLHRINRGLFVKVPGEEERRVLEKYGDCPKS